MRRMLLAMTAGALSLAGASIDRAFAEDPAKPPPFAQRLFGNGPKIQGKSYACFVRRYDAAHLARHPLQKVTAMKLLVTAENAPEDDENARINGNGMQYSFRLGLRFRDRKGDFDSSGSCGYPRASDLSPDRLQLFCGVDCDGGGIELEMANADRSMLLRVERVRIWQNNRPDDESASLSGGADDRVFRLDRARLDECRGLITDRAELAAIRRKP